MAINIDNSRKNNGISIKFNFVILHIHSTW